MKNYKFFLILIFLLALFLRVFLLGSLPHTFHEDEVLSGYVGRYILQNGFDLYGNKWPVWYFNKFGDYYIIGPIYLAGVSTYIFGINEFAVRFPAAFFGALTIISFFYFLREIFNNKKIALFSSLFLAILPWHIVLSRSTTEGIIGCFFFITGLYFLLKSLKEKFFKFFFLSFFFFLIGYWIYHPFRLYPFLALGGFLVIYFKKLSKKKIYLWLSLGAFLFFLSFSFYISQTYWGKGRFEQTSIFSVLSGVVIRYHDLIAQDKGQNVLITRLFHNKVIGYGREFLSQYFSYLSPVFLFINGWQKSRYFVPETGPLFFIFGLLILVGFLNLKDFVNLKNKRNLIFFFYLLLISLIPASLTVVESPNPHRSLLFGILLMGTAGMGIESLLRLKPRFIILCFLIIFFEFYFFCHNYKSHFDYFSALSRNDPQKEIANFLIEKKEKTPAIYITSRSSMAAYYLFYSKDFDKIYSKKFSLDFKVKNIKNINFLDESCPSKIFNDSLDIPSGSLIIDRFDCISNPKFKLIGKIEGVNKELAYKVLSNN